jgi:hypothetical protein
MESTDTSDTLAQIQSLLDHAKDEADYDLTIPEYHARLRATLVMALVALDKIEVK